MLLSACYTPWFGWFYKPDEFSKDNAKKTLRDAPGDYRYPAVLYLNQTQDKAARLHFGSGSSSSTQWGSGSGNPGSSTQGNETVHGVPVGGVPAMTLDFTIEWQNGELVLMSCLAIAMGNSRPWWVNLGRVVLFRPAPECRSHL